MSNSLVKMRTDRNAEIATWNELTLKYTPEWRYSFPGYCPECHYFKHLPKKNKDGKDICLECWSKENV